MESSTRVKFPYSNLVLSMPNGPEKTAAKARERARTYRLRAKAKNGTRKSNSSSVSNTNEIEIKSNIPVMEAPAATGGAGTHAATGGAGTGRADSAMPNTILFTEPISIKPFLDIARSAFPTSTPRTLYGEACEIFAEKYLPCRQCGSKEWIKAKRLQAAFDLTCSVCKTKYQIKGATRSHIKPTKGVCEIVCGRFPGVFECHKNTSGLDYYLFTYTDTHITNIYYVNHTSICANTNLIRRPVKVKSWKESKNYCTIKIGMDKCVQIM